MVALSVLDLSPIPEGADAAQAFRNTVELARHVERLDFRRYWLAEHHNMAGIGSAATAVLIGHVAGATETMRVGAGGIMLPNHAPLVIAEQFGTLESLYPGRIDLGIGRAPGTDQITAHALRRTLTGDVNDFPRDVVELQSYFQPSQPGRRVRAVPGAGLNVPIWILGSSLFGAQLAAALGLPYAFASHFAPAALMQAIEVYREQFRPLGAVRRTLHDGGVQRLRRRQRGRGGLRAELGPAIGAEPAPQCAGLPAPPGARLRGHVRRAGTEHPRPAGSPARPRARWRRWWSGWARSPSRPAWTRSW